jgi:hypothetical protein
MVAAFVLALWLLPLVRHRHFSGGNTIRHLSIEIIVKWQKIVPGRGGHVQPWE